MNKHQIFRACLSHWNSITCGLGERIKPTTSLLLYRHHTTRPPRLPNGRGWFYFLNSKTCTLLIWSILPFTIHAPSFGLNATVDLDESNKFWFHARSPHVIWTLSQSSRHFYTWNSQLSSMVFSLINTAVHNPCTLIRFKCDSGLSTLHSGRSVDKFWIHAHATHVTWTLSQSSRHFYTSNSQLLSMVFSCEAAECFSHTSKKKNQSDSQVFLQLIDSHSAKLTCSQRLPFWK